MEYTLLSTWELLRGENDLLNVLDQYVGWEKIPPFYRPGRTGWLQLDKPIEVFNAGNSVKIHSIKLKGIGYCDDQFNITKPTSLYFNRIFPHLGFSREGKFRLVESEQAPLGGLEYSRARTEYDISLRLWESGCPAVVPIRLYRYHQSFNGSHGESSLAVVITGIPKSNPFRADCAYRYDNEKDFANPMNNHWPFSSPQTQEERDFVIELGKKLNLDDSDNLSLSLISFFSEKYGRTLRKFHEAGFYRYSGSLDNYDYCLETDEVYLIDLDSSRPLDECTDIEKSLQVIRDLASAFFNLSAGLMHPWYVKKFPLHHVIETAPFESILRGYFHDVPAIWIERVNRVFMRYYNALHQQVYDVADKIVAETDRDKQVEKWKPFWMDRKEVYSLLMVINWFLYVKSAINERYPCEMDWEDLMDQIAEFAGPQIAGSIDEEIRDLVASFTLMGA
ncbi:hypothetical protein [Paenibacillus kobensis]|uniref:hypothetical protein n=1 Tax=Paenibacillus kobensis TaxID=59841 RepID=UPI000FDB64B0|nr:hypothetical protein [Paenibacillus kobensis]